MCMFRHFTTIIECANPQRQICEDLYLDSIDMASSDDVLSSLCTTCHAAPPQYKCPRCGARSCSLPCVRKHKAWASCSGIRDVTAFVPRATLQTPAGIDHDYNFLRGIERARDRVERRIVDEKALLNNEDIRPGDERGRWDEVWQGDELRFVPAATGKYGRFRSRGMPGLEHESEDLSVQQKRVRRTCRAMHIKVIAVPKGLSRHRENTTSWNKRTGRLNWQIEWLVYEDGTEADARPTKVLRKALDNIPLCEAFTATMEWVTRGHETQDPELGEDKEEGPPRKRRRRVKDVKGTETSTQHWQTAAWAELGQYYSQNPFTGAWDAETGPTVTSWARDAEIEENKNLQFYMLKPQTRPKQLIPLRSTETLADILPWRMLLEFPTFYVLPRGALLPRDHELGSTERPLLQAMRERAARDSHSSSGSDSDDQDGPGEEKQSPDTTRIRNNQSLRGARGRGGFHDQRNGRRGGMTNGRGVRPDNKQSAGVGPLQKVVDDILNNPPPKKRKLVQDLDEGEVGSDGSDVDGARDANHAVVHGQAMPMDEEDSPTRREGSASSDEDSPSSSGEERGGGGSKGTAIDEAMQEVSALLNGGKKPLVVYDSWSEDDE